MTQFPAFKDYMHARYKQRRMTEQKQMMDRCIAEAEQYIHEEMHRDDFTRDLTERREAHIILPFARYAMCAHHMVHRLQQQQHEKTKNMEEKTQDTKKRWNILYATSRSMDEEEQLQDPTILPSLQQKPLQDTILVFKQ